MTSSLKCSALLVNHGRASESGRSEDLRKKRKNKVSAIDQETQRTTASMTRLGTRLGTDCKSSGSKSMNRAVGSQLFGVRKVSSSHGHVNVRT
jgi:hypothetical protein